MLVLVDGHNLIAKMPDINLDEADDEERLVRKLRQYRARTGRKITVIFDPGVAFQLPRQRTESGLTVQYASPGKTADALIINRLRKARNPQQILVVTSDRAIQQVARQVKARVISADGFAQTLSSWRMSADEGDDVALSEDEIEEWLEIFNQK